MASSPRLRPQRSFCRRAVLPCSSDGVAGGPFFFAAKKFESGAEDRCRYGRSRRAILYRHDDCAASIPKSGIEIKNRCTQEAVNGEKHASIPKSGPEIKNHCSLCIYLKKVDSQQRVNDGL